jgi:hypothetical protein
MSISRSCRLFCVASGFVLSIVTLPLTAAAQQVTYYDFDVPQATPSQTSYACSPANLGSLLFCFNDTNTPAANPSYLSDTYPAIIDPTPTDIPPVPSTHQAIQMTPAAMNQATSTWFAVPQKITSGFTSYFTFKFTPSNNSYATADGIAFVIQNAVGGGTIGFCAETGSGPSVDGDSGGCLGYGGIDNSLAIEFDTYKNVWDPQNDIPASATNDNHIAIQNCGAGLPNSPDHNGSCLVQLNAGTSPLPAIVSNPNGILLADGNVHQVVITYAGPTEATPNLLQVFIDPPFNPGTHTPSAAAVPVLSGVYNIGANLNLINSATGNAAPSLDSAYVGFTSATGAAFEQHEVMNWTFTPHTTVTQVQPIAQGGQPTVFPFGAHVYATTYPADVPTSNISQQVVANTISPQMFSQLVNAGPFTGSQCQVYDETGGNCIVYSVSCLITGTNTFVQCPTTQVSDPITIKSAYNDSAPAVSPGYIQGDPFYNLVTSISSSGGTATVTCVGECAVTTGQSITLGGSQTNGSPSAFNGPITVGFADPSVPNVFTYATTVTGSATGGYLTSNNVENVFSAYSTQRIDGTTTGKVNHFSDFVVTSLTVASSNINITADTPNPSPIQTPVSLSFTVTGPPSPASPTGAYTVTSNVVGDPICSGTLVSGAATCSLTFLTPGVRTMTVQYLGDANFTGSSTTVQQTVSGPLAKLSASSLNFGTLYLGGIGLQSVTLTNIGSAPMTVNEPFLFDVGNGDSKEFVALSLCPGSLGVGKSCSIYIAFLAGPGYNTQTAILKVMDNAPGNPQQVSLTANVINPVAGYSPKSVSFGTVSVGTPVQSPVVLTNTGGTTLNLTSISIKGSNPGDFRQSNNCPATLAPKAYCTINTTFQPTVKGSRSASLYVVDNMQNGSQTVSLGGTGK